MPQPYRSIRRPTGRVALPVVTPIVRTNNYRPSPLVRAAKARLDARLRELGLDGKVLSAGNLTLPVGTNIVRAGILSPSMNPVGPPASLPGLLGANFLFSAPNQLLLTEALLYGTVVTIPDNTELIIHGPVRRVMILAERLQIGVNVTVAWQPPVIDGLPAPIGQASAGRSYPWSTESSHSKFRSPDGGDGSNGRRGRRGRAGFDAPEFEIWVESLNRIPRIELSGGRGGEAGVGQAGGAGGNGARGLHSASNIFNCVRGPGYGGDGGDGGNGGTGGPGGEGGSGGTVRLFIASPAYESSLASGFQIDISGGEGGKGGRGGSPGQGGRGGKQGSREGWCATAHNGNARDGRAGSRGARGGTGPSGPQGPDGQLSVERITRTLIVEALSDPLIKKLTPWLAGGGQQVTVDGVNFPAGSKVQFDGGEAQQQNQISESKILFTIPAAANVGTHRIVVRSPQGDISNEVLVTVLPVIESISPSTLSLGESFVVKGSGLSAQTKLIFRGQELDPDGYSAGSRELRASLPRPTTPTEEQGGDEGIVVRSPTGETSETKAFVLRRSLDTGFDTKKHAFPFRNAGGTFKGIADDATMRATFGVAELIQAGVTNPAFLIGFSILYRNFFNKKKPGMSSAMAALSARSYFQNEDIAVQYPDAAAAEPDLTVAMGHVLGQELLQRWNDQAKRRNALVLETLEQVEDSFRELIDVPGPLRMSRAITLATLPSGGILAGGAPDKLSKTHGLLPIRLEFGEVADDWDKRLYVYENQDQGATAEAFFEFRRLDDKPAYELHRPHVVNGPRSVEYESSNEWTVGWAPASQFIGDSSLPTNIIAILSPAEIEIEVAGEGCCGFGEHATRDELVGSVAACCHVKGLFTADFQKPTRVTARGTAVGTYDLVLQSGVDGRTVLVKDAATKPGEVDEFLLDAGLKTLAIRSQEKKQISLEIGFHSAGCIDVLVIEGLQVGPETTAFELTGRGLLTSALKADRILHKDGGDAIPMEDAPALAKIECMDDGCIKISKSESGPDLGFLTELTPAR